MHVPPLNHIGLWVHPLKDAVEYLSKQGVGAVQRRRRDGESGKGENRGRQRD